MFSPFFFAPAYATHLGYGASFAFYTLSAMNASSLFGRILTGIAADRLGAFNLATTAGLIGAVVCYCWTTATSQAGIMVWAIAYGFSSGAILSLQMHCATSISTKETYGTVLGAGFGLCSIAYVIPRFAIPILLFMKTDIANDLP
jgi:MFS family permease